MKLNRALELVKAPLEKNDSHIVEVNRFALRDVIENRDQQVKALAAADQEISTLKSRIEKLEEISAIFYEVDASAVEIAKSKLDRKRKNG